MSSLFLAEVLVWVLKTADGVAMDRTVLVGLDTAVTLVAASADVDVLAGGAEVVVPKANLPPPETDEPPQEVPPPNNEAEPEVDPALPNTDDADVVVVVVDAGRI